MLKMTLLVQWRQADLGGSLQPASSASRVPAKGGALPQSDKVERCLGNNSWGCPLTSTHVQAHMYTHEHVHSGTHVGFSTEDKREAGQLLPIEKYIYMLRRMDCQVGLMRQASMTGKLPWIFCLYNLMSILHADEQQGMFAPVDRLGVQGWAAEPLGAELPSYSFRIVQN